MPHALDKAWILATLTALALGACARQEPPPQVIDEELTFRSHVVFYAADRKTRREPPREALRVWMPYVVGDLYGAPNAGEIVGVTLQKDLSFEMDLAESGRLLEKALVPTAFTQRWMRIEPAEARIARLSPFVLPEDNIDPVGMAEWLDPDTAERYLLLYLDRPARVQGDIVYDGRKLRFDIQSARAGYLWVRQPEGEGTYRAASRPRNLVLAVLPQS